MPKYKLLSGSHTINKVNYKAGTPNNILDLTVEQAKPLGDRLVQVSESVDDSSKSTVNSTVQVEIKEPTTPTTDIDKDSVKLLDSNDINLITSSISTINDLTLLETLYNHEESNKNRQDILDAINKQYELLGSQEVNNTTGTVTAKKGKK